METDKIKKLFSVDSPSPKDVETVAVIQTNGHFSILKKKDGTFCLRNESTGQENGCFLTEQDAKAVFDEIISDESGNIINTSSML